MSYVDGKRKVKAAMEVERMEARERFAAAEMLARGPDVVDAAIFAAAMLAVAAAVWL